MQKLGIHAVIPNKQKKSQICLKQLYKFFKSCFDNMRVPGLDEKHIVNQMAAVFVDIETGELLEMKKTNKPGKISETIRKMEEKRRE